MLSQKFQECCQLVLLSVHSHITDVRGTRINNQRTRETTRREGERKKKGREKEYKEWEGETESRKR